MKKTPLILLTIAAITILAGCNQIQEAKKSTAPTTVSTLTTESKPAVEKTETNTEVETILADIDSLMMDLNAEQDFQDFEI